MGMRRCLAGLQQRRSGADDHKPVGAAAGLWLLPKPWRRQHRAARWPGLRHRGAARRAAHHQLGWSDGDCVQMEQWFRYPMTDTFA